MPSTATYSVSGMTCSHCVAAVQDEISRIPGVTDVSVELRPDALSTVTVSSDEPLPAALVSSAVDEAGYEISTD